MRVLVVDSTI